MFQYYTNITVVIFQLRIIKVGNSIKSIVFSNERDLLLTYKNYIIEIECQRFLPLHILQHIVLIGSMKNDTKPETPLYNISKVVYNNTKQIVPDKGKI